ncbi:hypothetical protein [Prosthecobacter sp.]|uniref:hypothetical protein n=1 Tax=Prosthecobacter sp. TaxID=1965333 RepID=UPI003784ECF7
MAHQDLEPVIRIFLSRYIRSIEELEILLLIAREPGGTWTAKRVYDAILSTPASVERWLNELAGHGLVEKSPTGFRGCSDAELSSQIDRLDAAYRTSPVRIIEAIYRPQNSAAQSFADAFKLKNTDPSP